MKAWELAFAMSGNDAIRVHIQVCVVLSNLINFLVNISKITFKLYIYHTFSA